MDDRLRRTNQLGISPNYLGQLSLLPSGGREMSTSQSAQLIMLSTLHFSTAERRYSFAL